MALSGLAIAGIIIIIIGIIMAIIGIVLLIVESAAIIAWYVWLLIIGGILLGIIGGIMLAVALSESTCVKPCMQPVPYVAPVVENRCPQYVAPVVQPTYVQPAVAPRPYVPPAMYSQRVEQVGPETFDPDPVTTVSETPSTAVRRNVTGPYGPNGENIPISGVYKQPGQRRYVTRDIPEHPVQSTFSQITEY